MDFDKYFVKSELIPAVIQEKSTGEVLMLAYMNRESMQKTFETGYTWFWSRSRQEVQLRDICKRLSIFLQTVMTTLCLLQWNRQVRLATQAVIRAFLKN